MLPFTAASVSATETEADKYLLGDVDMDGAITIRDATITQFAIAHLRDITEQQEYLADCNGNNGLQISDATYIQMYVVKLLTDSPVNADGYKIGDYVSFEEPTEPTTEPTTVPTEPTTAPTEPTTAPTEPTTVPTEPTTVPTEPTTVPTEPPTVPDTMTIKVGVIEYVYNETSSQTSSYQVHYWGGAKTGDATCTALNTTEKKSVGSSYWSNAAQTFQMFTVEIPKDSTGFKFHIGDRWFGADGDATKQDTVYIFNYSGDKALYE